MLLQPGLDGGHLYPGVYIFHFVPRPRGVGKWDDKKEEREKIKEGEIVIQIFFPKKISNKWGEKKKKREKDKKYGSNIF